MRPIVAAGLAALTFGVFFVTGALLFGSSDRVRTGTEAVAAAPAAKLPGLGRVPPVPALSSSTATATATATPAPTPAPRRRARPAPVRRVVTPEPAARVVVAPSRPVATPVPTPAPVFTPAPTRVAPRPTPRPTPAPTFDDGGVPNGGTFDDGSGGP